MKAITFFYIFLVSWFYFYGQEKSLILESTKKANKKRIVKTGEHAGIYLNNSDVEINGKITKIDENTLSIDTSSFLLKDIRIIKVVPKLKTSKKILLGGITLLSTAGVLTGFVLIFTSTHVGAPAAFFLLPAGIALDIASIQSITWSVSKLLGTGIYYYIGDEWYLYVQ